MSERGQTFTLEAFVAAILLLAAVAFALQVVSVSSNTAGAGGQEARAQHAGLAQGVLDEGAATGTLRTTLLYWNETAGEAGQFYDADVAPVDGGFYIARAPNTTFGNSTAAMFDDRRVRYNINLYFPDGSGGRARQRLVESGTPSDDAARVVQTVTLYDDTYLVDETATRTNVTLADVAADENSTFYAPDTRPDGPTYTVIRVEVVLWRT